jgi:hydrogenase maturation factor
MLIDYCRFQSNNYSQNTYCRKTSATISVTYGQRVLLRSGPQKDQSQQRVGGTQLILSPYGSSGFATRSSFLKKLFFSCTFCTYSPKTKNAMPANTANIAFYRNINGRGGRTRTSRQRHNILKTCEITKEVRVKLSLSLGDI